ncbi:MAG TPA: YciI family protein [Thermoanaerobaculia bacterium]|nr:YciI family protein [Thermoanaerobaculia bacterium]
MPQFILLLRDAGPLPEDMSPAEIQSIIESYRGWMEKMNGTGHKLRDGEGRVVSGNDGAMSVTDGPYAEAKEILGGFMIVEADDYDAAVALCQDSPHLGSGTIEIRQIER